jgi:NADH-quinone oxidoreductase subunit M
LWNGLDGTLTTFRIYMVVAAIGPVLAAGYLLWMFQRVAMGRVKPEFEHAHIHDVHVAEWIAWVPLLVLIVALGNYPQQEFKMPDLPETHLVNGISRAL